jgi:hypothetical protein
MKKSRLRRLRSRRERPPVSPACNSKGNLAPNSRANPARNSKGNLARNSKPSPVRKFKPSPAPLPRRDALRKLRLQERLLAALLRLPPLLRPPSRTSELAGRLSAVPTHARENRRPRAAGSS